MHSRSDTAVVVVTGAAGEVGGRVLARLDADPRVERVVAIDRSPLTSAGPKVTAHRRDLAADDLERLLDGAMTVIHLAFTATADPDDRDARRANLEGTRRLLAACDEGGVDHVVLLSSATVYGAWPTNPVPLTEDAPIRPVPDFAYAVHKAEVERLVDEWRRAHPGVRVAVLRPVTALAENGSSWLARTLATAAGLRSADSDPPRQFVHLDDLADAIDVVRRAGADGVFNVAPDGWIPGETARALVGGGRPRLPERLAIKLAEWSWELRLGPIPPGLLPYTTHPWVVANDRLRAHGWRPRFRNEEAFVSGTTGSRWSMMSPKRKQEMALGVSGLALLLGALAIAWLARRARRGN